MECPFNKMSSVSTTHSRVSAHWLLSFRFHSIIFISQNLLGDDVHETSRLCTAFTGTGTGAQGTFHPLPRGDFSLVYSSCCLVTRSCLTLFYPMDWTDCSVHGILQARILDWVAISSSRGSSWSKEWTHMSCIGRWILDHWAAWEAW